MKTEFVHTEVDFGHCEKNTILSVAKWFGNLKFVEWHTVEDDCVYLIVLALPWLSSM